LEIICNEKILSDEDEMECIFTSPEQPLIVFVPTELTMNEYKNYMTVALSSID
jgi:hypothetical protein